MIKIPPLDTQDQTADLTTIHYIVFTVKAFQLLPDILHIIHFIYIK